jgi:hypothetical protein
LPQVSSGTVINLEIRIRDNSGKFGVATGSFVGCQAN